MEILARGVGRRKEAVAQVQIVKGTGQFIINNIPAQQYLHNNTCSIISVKSPLTALNDSALNSEITNVNKVNVRDGLGFSEADAEDGRTPVKSFATLTSGALSQTEERNEGKAFNNLENMDTIVKVKGGGLAGQAAAIKLGLARALCQLSPSILKEHFSGLALKATADNAFIENEGIQKTASLPSLMKPVQGRSLTGGSDTEGNNDGNTEALMADEIRKQFKDKGFLTQDSRVKERRKYGLKKARKATQYNKR
uniref:Small ribosomal subunit protein uS9c n=1 Tax=Hyalogonium fusiforme TaxID=2926373 RepID=A0A9E7V7Q0_9CHLO|nr:ribosomal protein S9 [Hyalogonium fusiforme]